MNWMFQSQTVTVLCTLILAFVYGHLYLQYRERHMGIWALSWAIYAIKNFSEVVMLLGKAQVVLIFINQASFLLIGLLFWWGAYAFMSRPMPRWPVLVIVSCIFLIPMGHLARLPLNLLTLPMFELIGAVYLWTGVLFLRYRGIDGAGKNITGWAFILWGLHTGDYPFLRATEWFAPWGYLIGATIKMVLAIGILLVYFQKSVRDRDENVSYLNKLIENMNEMFFTYDSRGSITFSNRKCLDTLGYSPGGMVGGSVFDLFTGDCAEKAREGIRAVMERGAPGSYDTSVFHRDGSTRLIRMSFSPIKAEEGEIGGGMVLAEDITARKKVEEELNLQRAYFQQLFENSPDGIVMLDSDDRIIDTNRSFERLFQYSIEEIRGRHINDFIVPVNLLDEALMFSDAVRRGGNIQEESIRMRKDGSIVDVSILGYPIMESGRQVGVYGIYSDITGRKQAEEQLKYLSLHDPLTGIYNRAYFEHMMRQIEEDRQFPASILVFDVDGLKLVNDTLGHSSGDALLVTAANLIKEGFGPEDVVARIGGDEFAVLLPGMSREAMEKACLRIQEAVAGYNSANPRLPLSVSVGFATSGRGQVVLTDLYKEADNNMYREKLHRSQSARSAIVQTLMKALEARDYITEGHGDRLKDLAEGLARAVGLPERSITDLRLLAQFHDIGKVGIPDRILFKKGPLTQGEFTEMQRHSEIGHRIAQSAPDLVPIADWILKHHEWWNGEGYPLRIKGKDIPLECRILAIADAFDAMTNNRPYRKAMAPEEAMEELKRCAGTQFDPQLVSAFLEVLESSGTQGQKGRWRAMGSLG